MPTGDFYVDTIFIRDPDEGDAQLLGNIEVTVTKPGGVPAQIYQNEALSIVKSTPFITDLSGEISFWAPPGEYVIHIEDLNVPARIGARDYVWMAIPYSDYAALLPPGIIWPSARVSVPPGWLLCRGQPVSRSQYARLFAAIGDGYGGGDGATTFNVPDLRGRAPWGAAPVLGHPFELIGYNDGVGLAAANNRIPTHGHTIPAHKHIVPDHEHTMQAHIHNMWHSHYMAHTHGGGTDAPGGATDVQGSHRHSIAGQHMNTDSRAATAGAAQATYVPNVSNQQVMIDIDGAHAHNVNAHSHGIGTDGGTRNRVDGPQNSGNSAVIPNTGGPLNTSGAAITNTSGFLGDNAADPGNAKTWTDERALVADAITVPYLDVDFIIKT